VNLADVALQPADSEASILLPNELPFDSEMWQISSIFSTVSMSQKIVATVPGVKA
jgi:hypothetical protein